jgi:hypothetical protein
VTAPRASSSGGQVEPGGTPPAASLTAHACARHRGGGPPPRPTPASCTAPRHTARHACSCTVGLVRGNLLGVGLDSRWPAAAAVRCGGCTLPPCSGSRPAQTDLSPATNRCFSTPTPQLVFVNTFTWMGKLHGLAMTGGWEGRRRGAGNAVLPCLQQILAVGAAVHACD